jgi:hypothetical protein
MEPEGSSPYLQKPATGPYLSQLNPDRPIVPYLPKVHINVILQPTRVGGCTQKFPDRPPGMRTANGAALYHKVQLYRYFVSQSSEFCRHSPLCCFSTSACCCYCLFRNRLSPENFGYTFVYQTYLRQRATPNIILEQ